MSVAQPERILNPSAADGPPPRPRLYFEIESDAVKDEAASEKAGRPIYVERVYLAWTKAGAFNASKTREEVSPRNRCERFYTDVWEYCGGKEFYERWVKDNGIADQVDGTPLRAWPLVTKAQIRELEYLHVRSVEDLAALTDGAVLKLGGGYLPIVHKARKWLEEATTKGVVAEANAKLTNELAEQRAIVEEQQRTILELQAVVQRHMSQSPNGEAQRQGRSPKVA